MNRVPTALSAGGPQSSIHLQGGHSSPMLSGPITISGSLNSGSSHPSHGMQQPVPHDRDIVLAPSASTSVPGHYFSAMGVNPNSLHHVSNLLPHGHSHHFHHSHPILALNRIPHFVGQPELRIFEMNKRLQQRMDDCDSVWWEAFTTDFFEDDATLTIGFLTEDGPKRYTIGRTLIPRYFRSIFESGCGELYYNLRLNHEYFHHPSLTLDSELATMTMNMMRAIPATVVVEGRLTLEFSLDELMRIKSWIFLIRSHREMIMRSMLGIQDPAFLEQLTKNITRYGMTPNTLNFFRLCVILEPMQELMSRQKAYSLTPRDCLKTTLFQKWQRMMPQEAVRQPSKRRKRKGSAATNESSNNSASGSGRASKRKQSPVPIPPHHIAQPGDVMIVGEPTLMGGDFGDDDERLITRLENTQYDANATILPSASHIHPNFPGSMEPHGLVSSPVGVNVPLNCGPHSIAGVHFRGSIVPGSLSTHSNMAPNDPNYSNSVPPIPTGIPVSIIPGQQSMSASGRFTPYQSPMMMTQSYMPMPAKYCMSGGANTPSCREMYHNAVLSGSSESVHLHPVRSNSTSSSLLDGGFPTCPSPNMLPSRPPARFTPPGLPNGVGVMNPSVSQSNFLVPPDMMGCPNSINQLSVSGNMLCSPPPTSYTPEAMETGNLMHPNMTQVASSTIVKSSDSPRMFSCLGSNANGSALSSEPSLMAGSRCDPLAAVALNDANDLKPLFRGRSNSESL